MSDAPNVRMASDGRVEYRASALGGCLQALLAARLGFEPVPLSAESKMMQVFEAGKKIEEDVLDGNPHIFNRQREVRLPVSGRLSVVGHIDGQSDTDDSIVEVKSQNKEEWDRFERVSWEGGLFPKYKWQVSCYMLATRKPLKLIRALRGEDGKWTGKSDVSYVIQPFYSLADIRQRILRIEAQAASGVLLADCDLSFPCPFFYLHEEMDRELVEDETIEVLAREYSEASRDSVIAKGKMDVSKKALREVVGELGKYVTKGGIKVTFYKAQNPPKLDKERLNKFLEKYGKDVNVFMDKTSGERIKVTMPKEEDESTRTDES